MTTRCQTCEWTARRDRGEAPPWDSIVRTAGWDVVHAQGTSLAGWMVLVARRHIEALADLTEEEAAELGPLVVTPGAGRRRLPTTSLIQRITR